MPNKDVILHLDGSNPPPVVVVTEADTAWTFRFTVMYQNAIYAPNVNNVILAGHKPDGNAFAFLGSKSGNTFNVGCNVQMTAVPGDVLAALHLLGGGNTAIPFILRVQSGAAGTDPVASVSALPAYTTILNKIGNFPPNLAQYVSDWLAENVLSGAVVDNTFTIEGAAAPAKLTGDRLTALDERVEDLENAQIETDATLSQEGAAADAKAVGDAISALVTITPEIKNALLSCLQNVAWANPNGQSYVTALNRALNAGSIVVTGGKFVPNLAVSTGNGIFQLYYDSSTYNRLGFALDGTGDHPMRMASSNPTTEQSFYPIPVPQDARQLKLTLPSSVSFVAYFAKWTGTWSIVASSGAWDTGYGGGTVDISEANDGNLFFACGFRNSSNSAAITGIDRESLKLEWIV